MTGQLSRPAVGADGRLCPDRRTPPLHRDGAGGRVGRRDRGWTRQGRVDLPNRAASELMGSDLMASSGLPLEPMWSRNSRPIVAGGASRARAGAEPPRSRSGRPSNRRTLLVRIGTEMKGDGIDGFVVTFDDITELLSAQRKAAWSDVARRIAHEIKNPLTPDPACGGAAEATVHQGNPSPTRSRSRNAPTPSFGMSAISAAWLTSSAPSPACRSR